MNKEPIILGNIVNVIGSCNYDKTSLKTLKNLVYAADSNYAIIYSTNEDGKYEIRNFIKDVDGNYCNADGIDKQFYLVDGEKLVETTCKTKKYDFYVVEYELEYSIESINNVQRVIDLFIEAKTQCKEMTTKYNNIVNGHTGRTGTIAFKSVSMSRDYAGPRHAESHSHVSYSSW